MIEFDVKWFDLTPNILSGEQPAAFIDRPKNHQNQKAWAGKSQVAAVGEFWVPQGPTLDQAPEYTLTVVGDHVRVPVHAYRTLNAGVAAIFGLGVQIGLAAITHLRNHTDDVPKRVTLILGHQCTDLRPADDAFRCYVGIAVQTK